MGTSFSSMYVHLTFGTKDGSPSLVSDMRTRMHAYLAGILKAQKELAIMVSGPADHVHVLMSLSHDRALSDVVEALKVSSTKWVHQSFPEQREFAWQQGYAAFTVSRSNLDSVARYIARQEERHQKLSFRDEFIGLLLKHGIGFEEKLLEV
jgi:putative transposase